MMYAKMVATIGFLGTFVQAIVLRQVVVQVRTHAYSTRNKLVRDKLSRNKAGRRHEHMTKRLGIVSIGLGKTIQPGGISKTEVYTDCQVLVELCR